MTKFTDATGREWGITLLVADLKRVKATLGTDAIEAVTNPDKLGTLLFAEPEKLVTCLYDLTRAEKAGIDPDEFAGGFDCDALERGAFGLIEEALSYTPLRKKAAAVVATLREKLSQAGEPTAAVPEAAVTDHAPAAYSG